MVSASSRMQLHWETSLEDGHKDSRFIDVISVLNGNMEHARAIKFD